ncbi:MAG: selenide, water dikinase SelD [Pseudomonadota bacterium]
MQAASTPVVKDLVLLGGGHAHVSVLKNLGMNPIPGLRITLITRDIHTPYSGMLPGFVSGHYNFDECHIDLGPLTRFAKARLYHGEVQTLNLKERKVCLNGRPPVSYDILSINTGSTPSVDHVKGAKEFAIIAKPIDIFLQKWNQLRTRIQSHKGEFKIVVVGGGAGGVELMLSIQYHLNTLDNPDINLNYTLLTKSDVILPTHNSGVRNRFSKILESRAIEVHTECAVTEVGEHFVETEHGSRFNADAVIYVTNASAPAWPEESGLQVDEQGFIQVNHYLQSVSHAEIFTAGDVASLPESCAKSGVFAVKQGKVLAENLKRIAVDKNLITYRPQKDFLSLISTGNQYAVASRGAWTAQGSWLWVLKNWIDQRFMQKYNDLPEMKAETVESSYHGLADDKAIKELSTLAMRCGGCGAKVGSQVLSRVMERLPVHTREDVLVGRDSPDDSAMLAVPAGKVMVQSVDYFRAFIDDNYLFGAISANHAMGDLYAMGAEPQSVLAIATVPYGRESVVEETLYELLAGAMHTLEPSGAILVGGHSAEGSELAFGLTVNGLIDPKMAWRKSGLNSTDVLILTKPIGTGTLFAADMRYQAKGRWIDGALNNMLLSNQNAAHCLQKYGVSACTDLTGFGLVGHLVEMTRASNVGAQINIDNIPILEGARETVAAGILSSLQPQNVRLRRAIQNLDDAAKHPDYPLIFDPQTAGGLLAGISEDKVSECLAELQSSGYPEACEIGKVISLNDTDAPIRINISL